MNYNISLISRHQSINLFHSLLYISHDILLPVYFLLILQQLFGNKRYHKIAGILLTFIIAPLLFITGVFLSLYMNADKIIFLSYGFSFIVLNIEVIYSAYKKINFHIKFLNILAFVLHIITCSYLIYNGINDQLYTDFLSVLWYMPFLHLENINNKIHNKYHLKIIKKYLFVSMLGTVFSFTSDKYWIRTNELHIFYKYTINQIPLFILF